MRDEVCCGSEMSLRRCGLCDGSAVMLETGPASMTTHSEHGPLLLSAKQGQTPTRKAGLIEQRSASRCALLLVNPDTESARQSWNLVPSPVRLGIRLRDGAAR